MIDARAEHERSATVVAATPSAVESSVGRRAAPGLVRYGAYPAFALASMAPALVALNRGWNLDLAFVATSALVYGGATALESVWPYRDDWRMDGRSFIRDLKFAGLTLLAGWIVAVVAAGITVRLAALHGGVMTGAPLAVAVPAGLLVYELANYAHHRWSHWGHGRVGGFLWRVHAVHHVPDRMYAFMTIVGHPINVLVQRVTTTAIPVYLLGLGPDAVFLLNVVVLIVGTVSHWNVDSRLGPLNYVLVGPEVHRWHHDAEPGSTGNFGTVFSIYDLLLGTLHFRRGVAPARIGTWEPEIYPPSHDVTRLVAYAFQAPPDEVRV